VIEDTKPITAQVIAWAAGQPFNNVLLMAILFSIGWGGYYTVTVGIPSHLQQIQKGYESLTESHRDEREQTLQLYDRWMNRTGIDGVSDSKVANTPVAE
tara:strand:- start:1523 stop:1819 length:297 start_codon:yes stop_codon:yes gene_type:complete